MNGSSYVKIPLRSSAILNIEANDNFSFIWSILAYLHPIADSKNGHATRNSNYRQYFNEININGSDFSTGFICNDVHRFKKVNNLSVNVFESNFYQDQIKWKHKLIPIEVILKKNISDRVVELIIFKIRYALSPQ